MTNIRTLITQLDEQWKFCLENGVGMLFQPDAYEALRTAALECEKYKEAWEKFERFSKEVLEIDKAKWEMSDGEDPNKEWNDCNGEWVGDIKRLARIHGIK